MWIKILCYFCCQRGRGPKLSRSEKRKKWLRLVAVMSIKQYGTRLIANFFYAFLFAEALTSMKAIWKDFKEYSDCNNSYTANLTQSISEQYSEAADQMADAMMATSACLTGTVDVDVAGFGIGVGDLIGGVFGDVFDWFTPGEGMIPTGDLDLQSNSDKVMQEVADDLQVLGTVAFWVRMVGFVMTFVTIGIILLKATYYTVENLPWKPGAVGLTMRLVEAFRVVAVYVILMGAVFIQAYLTDKSCQVNVNNTVVQTPMCDMNPETCEFSCTLYAQNFSSPCTECDIQYAWWWVEPMAWPNILGVAYILFIFVVIILELKEAGNQKKELKQAELREKAELEKLRQEKEAERERRHQERDERKKRDKKKKKSTSKYQPPEEQTMETEKETRIQVESDGGDEEKHHRKKKSSSKSKSSSSKNKSEKNGKSKSHDPKTKDSEITVDEDAATISEVVYGDSAPSSSYRL